MSRPIFALLLIGGVLTSPLAADHQLKEFFASHCIRCHGKDEQNGAVRLDKPADALLKDCLLYTSPSPRDLSTSRMPSSA